MNQIQERSDSFKANTKYLDTYYQPSLNKDGTITCKFSDDVPESVKLYAMFIFGHIMPWEIGL